MFKRIENGVKGAFISAALKALARKDRLSQIFFSTMASTIERIVLVPASYTVGQVLHDRIKNPQKHGQTYSGTLAGVKVSLIRTNVGGPCVANVMEVLAEIKPRAVIRVDYAGSLVSDLKVGALFVATSVIPGDGTSAQYIHANPSVFDLLAGDIINDAPDPVHAWLAARGMTGSIPADKGLVKKIETAAREKGVAVQEGVIWSTDGLFTEAKDKVAYWRERGAIAVDMETSCLYLLGMKYAIPSIAIHVISDNLATQPPFYDLEKYDPGIEDGLARAINAVEGMLPSI
jgi:purine-nucleoside phosphorylase